MAKQFSDNTTDTAIAGVTALAFAKRGLINFEADFGRKQNGSNGDLTLVNITSAPGCLEKFRYSYSEVANVYAGTQIDPAYYGPSKKGVSLLIQLSKVWSETDDADATYRKDVPFSAHLVLKYPQDSLVTAARVEDEIGRLLSGLYNTGKETSSRLGALIRGSLEPTVEA